MTGRTAFGEAQDRATRRSYAFECEKRIPGRKPAPRPCERCQAFFSPKRENPKEPARFCSSKCRTASWREEQKKDRRIEALTGRVSTLEIQVAELMTWKKSKGVCP